MTRLSRGAVTDAGRSVVSPSTAGIVHLGIGAFARAHTAVFTEDAMVASGDDTWGIVGVTQRSADVARMLAPQDGLFSVLERGAGAATTPRIIGSVVGAIAGREDPQAVVAALAEPSIHVVTLTVTEKGYRLEPGSDGLNLDDPEVRADLAGGAPVTAVGQVARGLLVRADRGLPAPTIVSCDNLPGNGAIVARVLSDFAAALPESDGSRLAHYLTAVATPDTMVDRMVPATTASDLAEVERLGGFRDDAAVVAEPFRQWVIEDRWAGRRPDWERVGAHLVSEVRPWEAAKLQLLNATHSLLAYLGLAAGLPTIAAAVADPAFATAAGHLMYRDALPILDLPEGLDGERYCAEVIERFANPALGHTTAKVGADGSQKLGPRLLSTASAARSAGRTPEAVALAVAAWMWHVSHTAAVDLDDPLTNVLHAALDGTAHGVNRTTPEHVVGSLLGCADVFPAELAADRGFSEPILHWYRALSDGGIDAVRKELSA